ncbi:uncharacterized protein ACBR49_006679 isoform 2-T2 [Aulostomus maculatus]
MDVSIAVSLIRGQMGAVVERAVNGAVETVLAEMLKVVGVKFEELKSQVALMKRDVIALQREKALKEKENDNIRAKLRYTELKLKYYRQGVEEELQQRASASTLVRIHQSTFPQAQTGGEDVSSTEKLPSCSTQIRAAEGALARNNQECTSPQSISRRAIRVRCQSDMQVASSDLLLPVSLSVSTPVESLDSSTEQDIALSKDEEREDDCEWTITVQPHTECMEPVMAPPPAQALTHELGQQSAADSLFPDVSAPVDTSTLIVPTSQVKKEAQQQQQEEEHVICIKEEPEEEQEVMATLLLDSQVKQSHGPEAQMSATEWSRLQMSQRNRTDFSSAGQSSYPMPLPAASSPSVAAAPSGIPPHQVVHPWTKDLSLYEEYKLRRNELRRRSLNRRRELEKSLPQPLLADLVRERREKTRLRVARWRAKRKLQACLNQVQAQGGAAGLSPTGFSISCQQQQHKGSCASTSSPHSNNNTIMSTVNSMSAPLPFTPPTSSCSSTLLLGGPNMATHVTHHPVMTSSSSSSSSSCSYPQVNLSQSISLADSDILQ